MENLTVETSENSKVENSENAKAGKAKRSPKKEKEAKTDSINFDKVKIDLSKGKKDLLSKERSVSSKKNLYSQIEGLGEMEQKKFRGKIRRELHKFVNSILGKDRSASERETSVKAFLKFYKTNWKIQDFKIENFTQSQNASDLKDYSDLLKYVQSILK